MTAFLADDPKYGELWRTIEQEYTITRKYVLILSGKTNLMYEFLMKQLSIYLREKIVLPITTIKQYALTKNRELEEKNVPSTLKNSYEKLVIRCSFGIINTGRNSA